MTLLPVSAGLIKALIRRFQLLILLVKGYQLKDGVAVSDKDLSTLRVLSETAPDPISTFA